MAVQRKRGNFNERVKAAHERKVLVEENRRIDRMECEANMCMAQKRKRIEVRQLLALTAGMVSGISFSI